MARQTAATPPPATQRSRSGTPPTNVGRGARQGASNSPGLAQGRRASASASTRTGGETAAPTRLSDANIAKAIDAFERLNDARQNKRARFSAAPLEDDDDDDDPDSASPIMDRYVEVRGPQSVHTATNFYPGEFEKVWRQLKHYIATHWNVGSGRKYAVTDKDMLFMSLTALKQCGTWDFVAAVFSQTGSTFSTRVVNFLKMLRPCLHDKFIRHTRDKHSMKYLTVTGKAFTHFPEARYAVDVTFQQAEAPAGGYAEKKKFFSKKHGLYGHKVEVAVVPPGFAVGLTSYYKGSVSDKTIFDENEAFHQSQLIKLPDERNLPDNAPLKAEYPNHWAFLADKGYQGVQNTVRGLTPSKKPPGGHLSVDEMATNDKISSDRVIVENFFGRLKTLWSVISSCWKWDRENYDLFFECCVAFTNVHIGFNGLAETDANEYRRYMRRLKHIAQKMAEKRATTQKRYKAKRRQRLVEQLGENEVVESEVETDYGDDSLMDSFLGD